MVTKTDSRKQDQPERKYTPLRLTIHHLKIIEVISKRRAIGSRSRVIEWALGEIAERDGITKGGALS